MVDQIMVNCRSRIEEAHVSHCSDYQRIQDVAHVRNEVSASWDFSLLIMDRKMAVLVLC